LLTNPQPFAHTVTAAEALEVQVTPLLAQLLPDAHYPKNPELQVYAVAVVHVDLLVGHVVQVVPFKYWPEKQLRQVVALEQVLQGN